MEQSALPLLICFYFLYLYFTRTKMERGSVGSSTWEEPETRNVIDCLMIVYQIGECCETVTGFICSFLLYYSVPHIHETLLYIKIYRYMEVILQLRAQKVKPIISYSGLALLYHCLMLSCSFCCSETHTNVALELNIELNY